MHQKTHDKSKLSRTAFPLRYKSAAVAGVSMQKLVAIFHIRWFIIILLFTPSFSYGTTVHYNLILDQSNPEIATISVDTSSIGIFTLELPRSISPASDLQRLNIECITISNQYTAEYGKEIQCNEITWPIRFNILDKFDTNVSKQENLYSPVGWWVLFEWDDIPRLAGHNNIEICTTHIDTESRIVCRRLPASDEPPLIMAWGNSSAQKLESNLQFNIYADNAKGIMSNSSWSQLIAQYDYLIQLFPSKETSKKEIDLIWVGIDASVGSMGGAAGSQAFISNYIVKDKEVSQKSMVRVHWVSGHEIFHMLTTYTYPTWISESLAHYYGYKSLSIAGAESETPIDAWNKNKDRMPHATIGLYEAHDMVANKNDMSYYGLFYVKGAAFWEEIDIALNKKDSSLDEYLEILSGANQTNGQFNDTFVKAIIKTLGKSKYTQLVSRYLMKK